MKTHTLTCCILLAFTYKNVQAAVGKPVSPGKLVDYQKKALELTNRLRAKHHSPPLQYDQELLKNAADCAKHYTQVGNIDHTCPYAVNEGHGENLALYMGNPSISDVVQKSVQAWYDEKKDYNFGDPQKSKGVIGHFTQLVWKNTRWVGMDALMTSDNRIYVVAIYDPPGNAHQPPSAPGGQYGLYKQNVLPEGGGGSAAPHNLPSSIFWVVSISLSILCRG